MIRSALSITYLLILPYLILTVLYLLIVGGGGAWLYLEARDAKSRILVDELLGIMAPLVEKLPSTEAVALMGKGDLWLQTELKSLFAQLPELREVSIRNRQQGYGMRLTLAGTVNIRPVPPLDEAETPTIDVVEPSAQRLLSESGALFRMHFNLADVGHPPVELSFEFNRAELLARVREAMSDLTHAITLFGIAGSCSILISIGITFFAISAVRRIESHFQELYRRASMAELAAALVHELRNPLMALRANMKALQLSSAAPTDIAEDMERDLVALNDKLNGFLDLNRDHEATFEPVDIRALIEDAARLAEPALAHRGLMLELDLAPDLPHPTVQAVVIRDALLNLILNAAQSGQTEGAIRVHAQANAGTLTLSVEDQGAGIAPEALPRLFEPFYTTKKEGNGLGLSIVKRIVEHHHGQVMAENRREGGARITLMLPIKHKETPRWWKAK